MDTFERDILPENSRQEVEQPGPGARPYRISLVIHVFSLTLILLSWSVFNWLSLSVVVAGLLPCLLLATGLSWLLDGMLRWQGVSRLWLIETDWRGLLRYITLMVLLTAAGPVYAYFLGIWMARSFISAFDVEVSIESQELLLVEWETDPVQPYLFRGVTTVYSLLDSVEIADAKLRERFQNETAWRLSNTSYFWASCDRERIGRYITMFLTQGEGLHVAIHYGVPGYCFLH